MENDIECVNDKPESRISWFRPLTGRPFFPNNKNNNKRRESVTDAVIPLFSLVDDTKNHDVLAAALSTGGTHHAPESDDRVRFPLLVDAEKYFSVELDENDFRQPWAAAAVNCGAP